MTTIGWIVSIAAFVVAAVIFFLLGIRYRKNVAEREISSAEEEATRIINEAIKAGETKKRESILEAKDEIHQTLGDAALIHDIAGQNKERDGGQAELAHAHKGALGSGQHGYVQINGRKDGSQRRDCNGVRDRHAEEQQHQQHCQNYE